MLTAQSALSRGLRGEWEARRAEERRDLTWVLTGPFQLLFRHVRQAVMGWPRTGQTCLHPVSPRPQLTFSRQMSLACVVGW